MVRLQKYLAEAGVASRRLSEQIILAGRVTVNGQVARILGTRVDPNADAVTVDGRPVRVRKKMYLAVHKPRGYLCSRKAEPDRRTIYDLLPREWTGVFSVGRLDYESEGLIFLTNDGDFCLRLTHPRYGVLKSYLATIEGRLDERVLQKFREGIDDAGEKLKVERARILSSSKSQSLVEMELAEGRNREIRRLFESEGLTVKRLQRVRIGRIKLGELPVGKWRTLTEAEIKSLLGVV